MGFTFRCFFALMVLTKSVNAQSAVGQLVWSAAEVKVPGYYQNKQVYFLTPNLQNVTNVKNFANSVQKSKVLKNILKLPFPRSLAYINEDYSISRMGWVCRQEWKLEKTINFPVKLRLGNIEQVDFFEGKNVHQ